VIGPLIQFGNADKLRREYLFARDIRPEETGLRVFRTGAERFQLVTDGTIAIVPFFRIVVMGRFRFRVMTRIRINVPGPKQTGSLAQVQKKNQTSNFFLVYRKQRLQKKNQTSNFFLVYRKQRLFHFRK